MATKRLSMRQTREILRQKFLLGRSHRDIAGSLDQRRRRMDGGVTSPRGGLGLAAGRALGR